MTRVYSPVPLPSGMSTTDFGAFVLELHGLLEPVAGNVAGDFGDPVADGGGDAVLFGVGEPVHQAQDGVTHDHRRFCRVEHDDGLAAGGSSDVTMASEVVSVNSSMLARVPGPADLEEMEATISP